MMSCAALMGKWAKLHEWHEGDGADQILHCTVPEQFGAGPIKNASVS